VTGIGGYVRSEYRKQVTIQPKRSITVSLDDGNAFPLAGRTLAAARSCARDLEPEPPHEVL
jgi:hypothetical protein